MIKQRLESLRALMREKKIDAYLVPTADFHESEYVGDYFKCRDYITNFTGSAGTAVITLDQAGLWTDGRYFVQAEEQLADTGITLFRMGQPETPSIEDYLAKNISVHGCLGFDGRVVNAQTGEDLRNKLKNKDITVTFKEDLIGQIWTDRPQLPANPVWILEECYAGKSAVEKINDVRAYMTKESTTVHLLTTLDDIMWLLNIRGNDIPCNPVALSYLAIDQQQVFLFIQEQAITVAVNDYLRQIGVVIKPYQEIYQWVSKLSHERVLIEKSKINDCLFNSLDCSNQIEDKLNPTIMAKAMKNPVEVENMRQAHLKDGVAVTKFIYWLKNNVGKTTISEISASDYLEQMRMQQEGYLGPSFNVISSYREHAAIVHYSATPETNKELAATGLYLVDSGGQYYQGTTDITRTIALGPITEEEQMHMTLVTMSMLRLGQAKFLHGCTGISLDYIAREAFWSRGLNYDHGTGHGVGYLLNVHERPNGIRYRVVPERMDSAVLEEGMITSDEPGIYIAGSHGVRIENLMVCNKAEKNLYGQFMEFEFLTYVPIDLDALDISLMEKRDIENLNLYHQKVYEKISPSLTHEEQEWLFHYTRPI